MIMSLFSNLWSQLISFFTSGGVITIIVTVILAIVLIATIALIVNIYIAGLHNKGYKIGALRHKFFH